MMDAMSSVAVLFNLFLLTVPTVFLFGVIILNDETLITPEDLAKHLKVSTAYVYKMVRQKTLPFYHIGKSVRFSPSLIAEWLKTTANGTWHRDRVKRNEESR